MASGVEMMLKALGIDPEEIKRSMFETIERLNKGINELGARLNAIDARLDRLERHLGCYSENTTEEKSQDYTPPSNPPTLQIAATARQGIASK